MDEFVITLISRHAIASKLDAIAASLARHSLEIITTRHLNPGFTQISQDPFSDAYALKVNGKLKSDDAKSLSQNLGNNFLLDACVQNASTAKTPKKLACFDMDSTLIQQETMDQFAYQYGIGDEISSITESAMRGELSFQQSFEKRLACLKGFDTTLFPQIEQSLEITPGAINLVHTLRAKGVRVAILSGGFKNFAVNLQTQLGRLDAIHANELEIENGELTGKISNPLIDETRKKSILKSMVKEMNLDARETITVGDGANDIPMLQYAGLGIAYHAKPIVQEQARHSLNHNDLSAILYLLGYERKEFILAEV